MAEIIADDYDVVLNGTDISDHVTAIDIPVEADVVDKTAMQGGGWRSKKAGLKQANVTIGLNQDYAAGEIDSVLWPLFATTVSLVVKPTNGAVSTSNPSFTMNVVISRVQPIAGTVGDLATMNLTWPVDGTVTRATS